MNKIAVTLLVGAACVALPLSAQSFSRNPHPPDKSIGQVPLARAPLAQQTITQSTATTITTGNSVSCNSGGLHTDNSYYRGMTLSKPRCSRARRRSATVSVSGPSRKTSVAGSARQGGSAALASCAPEAASRARDLAAAAGLARRPRGPVA